MKTLPHIATRVLNTPLLVEPGYARVFFSALAGRLGISSLSDADGEHLVGEKLRMTAASYSPGRERERPYELIDGVAVLPVTGSLTHKLGSLSPYSGMTGYDGLVKMAYMAASDQR